MWVGDLGPDAFVPFLIFSVPIVAIVGGITMGIVKTITHHRLMELSQRERIAAIERGVDPSKLPPPPAANVDDLGLGGIYLSPHEYSRRRSQNLMIGGIITLAVGVGIAAFLSQVARDDNAWAVGVIPAAIGIGLLLSAWIVRPREIDRGPAPPRQG